MAACPKTDRTSLPMLLLLKNHLEAWYVSRGSSVQLDGSSAYANNPSAWVYFTFNKKIWKLAGDTRDVAVKKFIDEFNQHGSTGLLIESKGQNNSSVLRIKNSADADGWYCTRG